MAEPSRCTRCAAPLPDGYGIVRMDDFWSDWDTRAELCKQCFDTIRAVLSGGEAIVRELATDG